jgi:spermidine synthase
MARTQHARPQPKRSPPAVPAVDLAPRGLAAVAVCLFVSGAASLMLEVVWTRLLRLVFGSTTLAVSTILVAYMLGLGLGGLAGGRVATRVRNGVRAYGSFEVAIALYAALVPSLLALLPMLNGTLLSTLGFWPAALCRFAVVLLVLLFPTLLMGATLPILVAAFVRSRAALASRVGLLYGLNTLGAVSGVFLSTFVLFPLVGVFATNVSAALLDLIVGVLAIVVLAPRLESERPRADLAAAALPRPRVVKGKPAEVIEVAPLARWNPALLAYGCVGFTALVYEVCWTRALSMVLGSSIYAFATMLAAFLTGIAVGSLVGRRWFDALRRPLPAYACGLAALGVLAFGTLLLFRALPDVFLDLIVRLGMSRASVITTGVGVSMLVMLGPTLVLGALFPLLTRALAAGRLDTSRTVGDVYFVNTMGSAAGAFAAGFFLIPTFGLRLTMAFTMAMDLIAAAGVLLWQRQWAGRGRAATVAAALAGAAAFLAFPPAWNQAGLTRGVFRDPGTQLDVGVEPLPLLGMPSDEILYYRDGINTTVSVHRNFQETYLRVNGKIDASTGRDMSTQVLLGQLPMLFGPRADRVLVIGLASGVTIGSVALHNPARLDVVELEPAMVEASHYFDDFNNRPLERSNVRVIADDARSYLAYAPEPYDVIISEPSNPSITGAASLFTREFFHSARAALRPGGRLLQWVQLYGLEPADLRGILAALHSEFPYIYGFAHEVSGPDLLLLATATALTRADLPDWTTLSEPVRDDLRRINNFSTADLWSLLLLPAEAVAEMARSGVVNTDDNMLVELHAPWEMNNASTTADNWRVLAEHSHSGLALAEGSGAPLDADTVGALALAHARERRNEPIARDLVREAQRRGGSANAMVAEVELLQHDDADTTEEALRRLGLAIERFPEAFAPRLYRAQLLYLAERLTQALDDIDAALRAQPGDFRARYVRAQILNRLDRPAEARAEAEALLATPYADVESGVWSEAARAAAALQRYDDAIREQRRYLERNSNWPVEWKALARMYEGAGRAAEARDAHTNAERADRNLVLYLHQRARRTARLGSTEEAIHELKATLLLDPTYAPAREDLQRLGASASP